METSPVIDFRSDETHLLLNPRLPAAERSELQRLAGAAPLLTAHVWISTSGTSGRLRLTALSKEALLHSAAAVNAHLEASSSDAWLCVLPHFHVGGLGIHARALLAGSRVVDLEWDAAAFHARAAADRSAFSALVPAQVADLVRGRFSAPPTIRAIIVGGGPLATDLYRQARALGWPLLPSYGMTETCSQVATASLASLRESAPPELPLLPHVDAMVVDGCLAFRGESLLTGYAVAEGGQRLFVDPKREGWFRTEDRGEVLEGDGRKMLRLAGRGSNFIKIGGESVDLSRLDRILDELLRELGAADAAVVAVADDRLGHVIHLATTSDPEGAAKLAAEFARRVLPFEVPRRVHRLQEIPRSPLRKLLRTRLLELLPL